MTKTILVPVEPSEDMVDAGLNELAKDDSYRNLSNIYKAMLEAAPIPTLTEDREEVARAIKHCFDTGKTRFDQITDAAISTLQALGWGKK